MSKLPAIQFYPGDWRKDPGVQALSFHDRGVWFEILLLMHESDERGKLMLNGQKMPDQALARLLGLDNQNLTTTLTTLLDYGVASVCETTGALMCRRMVNDEKLRTIRKNAGKKGGNPVLLKQKANQNTTPQVKQIPTPSSSSSTSTSVTIYTPGPDVFVPRSINTPDVVDAVGNWMKHLALSHPDKAILANSPQEEALWKMLADWRAPPSVVVSRVNECIASGWANLRKPEPQGNINGGRKHTSTHQTAAQRAEQANADAFAALQFADDD
jgi:hypothetical protein